MLGSNTISSRMVNDSIFFKKQCFKPLMYATTSAAICYRAEASQIFFVNLYCLFNGNRLGI